jgi:predicted DCC family thiol-disulfide oxidoreductase YuxK
MDRIVLFDGVCAFCNGSVNFIIRNDPKGRFKFCPVQSEKGAALLTANGLPPDFLDSLVLIENGRAYTHTTAALRIARGLCGLWPALTVFLLVPRFIRDFFYRIFAKNRYRMFGKHDACMMPTPEIRSRFL